MEQYLNSLIEGLKAKENMLDELTALTEKQQTIVSGEKIDWDAFDAVVDEKSDIIEKLNQNDEGFTAVFDRIKDDLKSQMGKYSSYIEQIKSGIANVTNKSTSLMALEQRTKTRVENAFKNQRKEYNNSKTSSRVATNYYNAMNKMNFVDPQLMDSKK